MLRSRVLLVCIPSSRIQVCDCVACGIYPKPRFRRFTFPACLETPCAFVFVWARLFMAMTQCETRSILRSIELYEVVHTPCNRRAIREQVSTERPFFSGDGPLVLTRRFKCAHSKKYLTISPWIGQFGFLLTTQ